MGATAPEGCDAAASREERGVAYLPIESYGLIGNMRTAALVGTNGSIDWLCFPHFDSPSIFAAILDDERGGRFVISPTTPDHRVKQVYRPDSNVLVTRFFSDSGVAEVTDYMAVGAASERYGRRCVIRHVRGIRGSMSLRSGGTPRRGG
jgi:GH15 family glucan-1,4-alpha-glucosidase